MKVVKLEIKIILASKFLLAGFEFEVNSLSDICDVTCAMDHFGR